MSELILHHYPASPFAEKARLMLGYKQLSWHSVIIPPVMPKPDLTALTGGYRRTPVLQVGADIYCDTALIARRLEAEKASPALFPVGLELAAPAVAQWADSVLFQQAVALVLQPQVLAERFARAPEGLMQTFLKDRQALFSGGTASRTPLEQALSAWPVAMRRLQTQLEREDGSFLLGEPSIADFAVAHPIWFLSQVPSAASLLEPYPAVREWLRRVLDFGHGSSQELSSAEAIEIARSSQPAELPEDDFVDPNGFVAGQKVRIAAVDYGVDPVEGELLFAGLEELILRREEERAGVVHVHFPRVGYRIEAI